ncbi:MAG TPA: thiamine pyrophosphate-dependent dehydrogenase E1 component subunit alpha, partial [Abditibacterium sp.]
ADYSIGFLGSNGITAGGIPIATGAALAAQMKQTGQVVVCFFGEGGANQGTFHESLNMAAIWKLPILFICENNQYAMSTSFEQSTSGGSIANRCTAYGMYGSAIDGTNFFTVQRTVKFLAERARQGDGPALIEASVYRYYGHSKSDKCDYRTREEEAEWRLEDPIGKLQTHLQMPNDQYAEILAEIDAQIDAAVEFARDSSEPQVVEWESEMFA